MTDIMEATKSKVKDVAGEKISDSPGKEDQDAGTSKNSILENLVTSVKRKLNQSLSPNSQKQEELGGTGSKVTAPKRSRGGPGSRTDLDDSLIIDEYDSEDERPLAAITKKRTRALVKAQRFKRNLQRKGTPIKTTKSQSQLPKKDTAIQQEQQNHSPEGEREKEKEVSETNEEQNMKAKEMFEKLQMNITEMRLETAANKIEIQRLDKAGKKETDEADKDHISNTQAMEMFEKLQKDITDMKIDTAANKIEIQQINRNAELMVSKVTKVVTQEQLDETIKKYTVPIQKVLDTQSIEIKRHTTEIVKIEESLGTIQVSLNSHETGLEERKRRDLELEHDIGIVRAEAISRVDELQRQIKDVQEQITVKNIMEKQHPISQKTYAQAVGTSQESEVQERAIIIEGVHERRDEQLDEIMFRMADEMRLPMYDWEINRIERIGSWRPDRRWPRPIKVEFTTIRKRDMFISNRYSVEQTEHFYRVRIRADEPLQTRQLKSKFRRAVTTARREGKRAKYLNDEEILIEGKKYNRGNIDKHLDTPGGDRHGGMPSTNQKRDEQFGGHCIKTPRGLAFFGYRSKLSSFYRCPIMREGKSHETLEHGYQGDKALDANDTARYNRIRNAKTAAAAKKIGGEIPNTERWNGKKRIVMRGWLFEKYRQHPDLADFLISTKGHQLIEASPNDSWWGAGAGLESQELLEGSWDGENVLGEELEYVREILIEERKPWQERFLGLVPRTPSPLQSPERQTVAARPGQIQGERGRVNTPNEEQPMDITIKPLSTRL